MALDLARWQFAITTIYHFLFVPLTIGLSFLVAGMQTAWVRTGKEHYLRATKFWGKLFLINVAMGVVTGIVQEFQFGMNWSAYSRFVGDIFGAPLAIEGLAAFFLESTFLGLWIFGWDRLSKRTHLATIWLAAIGTILSAYFILAANSWMQHPVGYTMNTERGRAELNDIGAVLFNSTTLVTVPHTIAAAFVTAGAFVVGIAGWRLARHGPGSSDHQVMRTSLRLGAVTLFVAGLATAVTGDVQAKIMTEQQPMKMAAAEALYDTTDCASFSIFTIGSLDGREEVFSVRVPYLLSFLATGTQCGTVEGINDVQAASVEQFGPGDYTPNIPLAYWSFRLMIGFGAIAMLVALWALWLTRRGRSPSGKWWLRAALLTLATPYLANSFGWIFTETGRQPWTVYGVLQTPDSVSPSVGAWTVGLSLTVFTLLYGALMVVTLWLMRRTVIAGPPDTVVTDYTDERDPDDPDRDGPDRPLVFAY